MYDREFALTVTQADAPSRLKILACALYRLRPSLPGDAFLLSLPNYAPLAFCMKKSAQLDHMKRRAGMPMWGTSPADVVYRSRRDFRRDGDWYKYY
jgi:hypothetical protein